MFNNCSLWSSKLSTDPLRPVGAGEDSHAVTPPTTPVNIESTSGGEATVMPAIDAARAGGDAENRRVAEPVGDGGADVG